MRRTKEGEGLFSTMAANSIPKGMQPPNGKGSMPAAVTFKRFFLNLLVARTGKEAYCIKVKPDTVGF
jgi:hypothetical protein